MRKKLKNHAFIDSQNLHLGIRKLGWKLDFAKFRRYLQEKYDVEKAYLFIGYVAANEEMYDELKSCGYEIIFKPTVMHTKGIIKGNCDAELVLEAMKNIAAYKQAVIVSGDGDFYCLVHYLREQKKLCAVIAPDKKSYSGLLKKAAANHLCFLNELRKKLGKQ